MEGNKSPALIDRFYRIVDAFRVVALVGKKGAFFQKNRLIRGREDLGVDGGTHTAAHCAGWRQSGHPRRS